MTLDLIRTLLSTDIREDFLKACRVFNSIDDDEELKEVRAAFPNLTNYDAEGNWIGHVSYENGWTQ